MINKLDYTEVQDSLIKRHQLDIERLRRMVIKLAHRVTTANKRIDELLRDNKNMRNKFDDLEATMSEILIETVPEEDTETEGTKTSQVAPTKTSHKEACITCVWKIFKYEASRPDGARGFILCSCPDSYYFQKEQGYYDWCSDYKEQLVSAYSGCGSSVTDWDKKKPIKPLIFKLMAIDLNTNEVVEEEFEREDENED